MNTDTKKTMTEHLPFNATNDEMIRKIQDLIDRGVFKPEDGETMQRILTRFKEISEQLYAAEQSLDHLTDRN
jgi:tRNA C32,U32 (ribose-2'-O)-methylase TrmJ